MQITETQFDELLYLYTLGALEPEEAAAMDTYVATHPAARARLDRALELTTRLALTPEQHDPPPQLRERVLRRVQQQMPAARPPQPSLWHRVRSALRPVWARTGLALVGALVALALVLGSRVAELQRDIATLSNQVATLNTQVTQQQAVLDIVQSPAVEVASLDAPDTGARAQVFLDPSSQRTLLSASNLPQLPVGQTYQFWLIGAQPISGGLFSVDANGNGSLVAESDQPLDQYQAVGISIEPTGGSATPTPDQIVLLGELPRPE